MARLTFTLRTYNETDNAAFADYSKKVQLTLESGVPVGTPKWRTYKVGDAPGAWLDFAVAHNTGTISLPTPGLYAMDYQDNRGQRTIAKYQIYATAEVCVYGAVPLSGQILMVHSDAVRLISDPPSAWTEAAVNGSIFKPDTPAVFTNAELVTLGIGDQVDTVTFRNTAAGCTLQFFSDVFIGDYTGVIPLHVSSTKTDSTAPGANDGTITLTVNGGSGNYSYQWDDGPTTKDRVGLSPGNYSVTVTDTVTSEVVLVSNIHISEPSPIIEDLTEEITIEVRRPSCEAQKRVYLCWLNTLGGWDQWLFEDQSDVFENEVSARTREEFNRYVEKLDAVQSDSDYVSREISRSVRLGTGKIGPDQVEGIAGLYTSSKVLMLISEPSVRPPQWLGVKVRDGSFNFNAQTQEAELVIDLPNLNVQHG